MPEAMAPAGQRLVCVTTSAALGGAETSLLTLLGALRVIEPSWELTVVAPADGPLLDKCRAAGIGAANVPYPAAMASLGETSAAQPGARTSVGIRRMSHVLRTTAVLWPYLRRLRRELRGRQATIVHSNGIKAHVATSLARPRGVRLVWHLHEYIRSRPSTVRVLRPLARRPTAIVANSD